MGRVLDEHGPGGRGSREVNASLVIALIWIVGFGAFVMAAVALVRRSERRLDPRQGASRPPIAPGPDGDPISTYLDRVTGAMALPAADVADVRAELIDHLQDSIATLESEGFGHEDAVREALGRLGPAAELGRQLGAAHQSTRRLLAGAGGGVFTAAGGFVLGYLGGTALAYVLLIVGAIIFGIASLVRLPVPDLMYDHGDMLNSLMLAVTLIVATFVATRYAVRTSAGLSRRSPGSVAPIWAVAAALGFGWLAIFGWRGPQSWPGVVAFMAVPVVAIAGAFYRIERPMPHVGRWSLMLGLGGVLVIGLSLALVLGMTVSSVPTGSASLAPVTVDGPPDDMHFDAVAPLAPASWLPEGSFSGGGWSQISSSSGTHFSIGIAPAALANWHDVRFEAWRGLENDFGIDTRFSAALAIQPALSQGTNLDATFHFERMRDAGSWWVVVTAVGPDGQRYRLQDSVGGGNSSFNGSVWDWLTAPQ